MLRLFCSYVLLAGVCAHGQQTGILAPPDPSEVIEKQRKQSSTLASEWLASSDARTRAWGAYLVTRDHLTERASNLLDLAGERPVVEQPTASSEIDDHDAMLAVLDALIQLHVDVPGEIAFKLYPEFRAQSMILLARSSSDVNASLLSIFQTEKGYDGEWLAAGNLLINHRASGFAAAVFSGLTVHASLTVVDGDGFGFGSGGSGGSAFREPRGGWPEIGTYWLSAHTESGELLVPGVHPARYLRVVNRNYGPEFENCCSPQYYRDNIRADYVGSFLGSQPGKQRVIAEVDHVIQWTNDAAYLSDSGAFITTQQSLFDGVATNLLQSGLLSESEAGSIRPKLEVTVLDTRASKVTDLPQLPDFGSGVIILRP